MESGTVTEFLDHWRQGDVDARAELFSHLYAELRKLAEARMRRERFAHTLQPTALVHEVCLRLWQAEGVPADNRGHFLAIVARVMNRVLVDYAREHRAQKRGGGELAVTLRSDLVGGAGFDVDALSLGSALERLAQVDPRKAEIVSQRFLCGATVEEVARALELSERTVKREWAFAKAWLLRELRA